MANELIKKATEVVNEKMCAISHDLQYLTSCLAKNHPVMLAISKDEGNDEWIKHVQDLINRIHTNNKDALDWNNAIRSDLQN